ncbi:hypothetical protein ACBI99_42945 [Nonomuraea sp. ATR24]|uniref:hypothetical protein n=1 Tax=Nonomuraea TaxID=83681 RepID=UPI001C5DBC1B|nr:hypothetical protein [Nonomuraea ceibae]
MISHQILLLAGEVVDSRAAAVPVGVTVMHGAVLRDHAVVDGLGRAPAALIGTLHGAGTGKMLVRLASA